MHNVHPPRGGSWVARPVVIVHDYPVVGCYNLFVANIACLVVICDVLSRFGTVHA